ncbi:Pre-mRNA splicing [Dimargaris verticillata]|uniref:Pre-mRNA splicing n=1 Tax=Dimargaris verticillata TaxID=2761393 RepID=A0A9W8AW16_9FUNG|nr:Pre-mRNA splicing [Dimargaris verticillata]
MQLPPDLASDQTQILAKMIPLIQACVDVLSSHGWLKPAMEAMELAQMCVQAQWNTESPLKQIPNFARELIQQAKAMGAESVFDVVEMADEDRQQLLASLGPRQVAQVADFVNRYPEIEVVHELADPDDIVCDQPATLQVGLERDMGEGDDSDPEQHAAAPSGPTSQLSGTNATQHVVGPVIAPYYPFTKDEGWWVVLGDPKTQTLASIKRVNFQERVAVKLEFVAPSEPGEHRFMLYLMSDSFVGCDQEFEVTFQARPDEEEDSDDEDANSDAMSASGSE